MNTSSLSLRVSRPTYRTAVGGLLQRVGGAIEKLWSLSGRVSLPEVISAPESARLPKGMVWCVERSDSISRLEMVQGTVWITSTPAGGDIVLGPGDACEFGDRWPYVIEALADAEFITGGASAKATPPSLDQ